MNLIYENISIIDVAILNLSRYMCMMNVLSVSIINGDYLNIDFCDIDYRLEQHLSPICRNSYHK